MAGHESHVAVSTGETAGPARAVCLIVEDLVRKKNVKYFIRTFYINYLWNQS